MGKRKNAKHPLINVSKKPIHGDVQAGKKVIVEHPFPSNRNDMFQWAVWGDKIDWEDPYYGFHVRKIFSFAKKIKVSLDNYATMTWAAVDAKKSNHYTDIIQCSKSLRDRLIQLMGEDAPETLYQLRLSGTHRIWGKRVDSVFYLMFDDPKHQGYIAEKKHT